MCWKRLYVLIGKVMHICCLIKCLTQCKNVINAHICVDMPEMIMQNVHVNMFTRNYMHASLRKLSCNIVLSTTIIEDQKKAYHFYQSISKLIFINFTNYFYWFIVIDWLTMSLNIVINLKDEFPSYWFLHFDILKSLIESCVVGKFIGPGLGKFNNKLFLIIVG